MVVKDATTRPHIARKVVETNVRRFLPVGIAADVVSADVTTRPHEQHATVVVRARERRLYTPVGTVDIDAVADVARRVNLPSTNVPIRVRRNDVRP